jgi:hypothetical protein
MDERPCGRIEWVRTRRGRVAHALLAETHPELDLRAIAWRHSWLANVQPGLPLCHYAQGSGDWQPAGRQRPCKVCALYLTGSRQAARHPPSRRHYALMVSTVMYDLSHEAD